MQVEAEISNKKMIAPTRKKFPDKQVNIPVKLPAEIGVLEKVFRVHRAIANRVVSEKLVPL